MFPDYLMRAYMPWRYQYLSDRIMGTLSLAGQIFSVLSIWYPVFILPLAGLVAILVPWLVLHGIQLRREKKALVRQFARLLLAKAVADNKVSWEQLSPEQKDDIMVEYARFRLRR